MLHSVVKNFASGGFQEVSQPLGNRSFGLAARPTLRVEVASPCLTDAFRDTRNVNSYYSIFRDFRFLEQGRTECGPGVTRGTRCRQGRRLPL